MRIALDSLPFDPITLQGLVRDLAGAVDEGQAEIDRLRQIIKEFQRSRFGRRSETIEPDQMTLGLANAALNKTDITDTYSINAFPLPIAPTKTPHRGPLPEHLPRTDITIPPDVTSCPDCGGALHDAGVTISEMLDWVPASVRVLRIKRPKCACRSCDTLHQAPAPERISEGCLATPGLIAHVLASRYCDHLPLYRQSQIFARQGVDLARSTLADWVGAAAWWLAPLRDRLMAHICSGDRIFADDTPLPILEPGLGRTRTGRLWAYARDDRSFGGSASPAVVFYATPDRAATWPALHLKSYHGILQVDGYAGFEKLTANGTINLAACWSHTRRKFYELHKTGSPIATEALQQIARLYAIDAGIRGLPPDQRQTIRRQHSGPVLRDLQAWFNQKLLVLSPRSRLAEAIRYAMNRWGQLVRFVDDGRIDLDTNPVERAIRPIALSRKNALFAGSEGGAQRWAIVASMIETAKLNGIEPSAWLKDTLTRMIGGHPASQIDQLLPLLAVPPNAGK